MIVCIIDMHFSGKLYVHLRSEFGSMLAGAAFKGLVTG
jgi:hypothetical protein